MPVPQSVAVAQVLVHLPATHVPLWQSVPLAQVPHSPAGAPDELLAPVEPVEEAVALADPEVEPVDPPDEVDEEEVEVAVTLPLVEAADEPVTGVPVLEPALALVALVTAAVVEPEPDEEEWEPELAAVPVAVPLVLWVPELPLAEVLCVPELLVPELADPLEPLAAVLEAELDEE